MPRLTKLTRIVIFGTCLIALSAFAQEVGLRGVWRGHSTCVVKSSPCHDEVNVYRITPIAGRPNWYTVSADKVVDGKEVEMGSGEWRYDNGKRTLTGELPRGVITLKLDGDKLEGTFTLPNKTVLRRITLKKSE